jgi:P-type conjugative transfer protein TrbJ
MRVQATVVGNLDTNRTQMSALVTASQGATGALQANQAGRRRERRSVLRDLSGS